MTRGTDLENTPAGWERVSMKVGFCGMVSAKGGETLPACVGGHLGEDETLAAGLSHHCNALLVTTEEVDVGSDLFQGKPLAEDSGVKVAIAGYFGVGEEAVARGAGVDNDEYHAVRGRVFVSGSGVHIRPRGLKLGAGEPDFEPKT